MAGRGLCTGLQRTTGDADVQALTVADTSGFAHDSTIVVGDHGIAPRQRRRRRQRVDPGLRVVQIGLTVSELAGKLPPCPTS